MQICEYGCEQLAKYQFKNGKWCCSYNVSQCTRIRKIKSEQLMGCKLSTTHKLNIGKGNKGTNGGLPIGGKPWNTGLKNIYSEKTLTKMSNSHKYSIKQIQKKYPTFAKIEEMRYKPGKEKKKVIQVHCKNHNCKNSKEQGGWFTPKSDDIFRNRVFAIEKSDGNGGAYYYCSEECKQECPLYGKRISQLIKQDQINAGYIKEKLYTPTEYQTWRTTVLIRENYICEYCDELATDVHHSRPQKLEPGFVLDPDFGVACCEKHHYQYGHKDECSTGVLANVVCEGI